MTDAKLVGVTLIKNYDDGTTETWVKVAAPAIGAILAAGLATAPVGSRGTGSKYVYENVDACSEHGTAWTVKEGGSNAERGTQWPAFWKCDAKIGDEWCNHRPSKAWVETHPPSRNDASQAPSPEPTATPAQVAGDFDDLPF
jgi:hypothetical protein